MISACHTLTNGGTQYILSVENDIVLCAYKGNGKRTKQLRVVDHDRLLATVSCLLTRDETPKVTLRIIEAGNDKTIKCSGINDCRTVAYNWKPSTIEFGQYSVRVTKQELFHLVGDSAETESIVALKADIWNNDAKRSIVKGGLVTIPATLDFNRGNGQHKFTIVRNPKDKDQTPVFTLEYLITDAHLPTEKVHVQGMVTTDVYRGIGIGSTIIERFLGSFYDQTPIELIAVSEAAERFWTSVGFWVQGSGATDMPDMVGRGTNTKPYLSQPLLLEGMYTLDYEKDKQIQLLLQKSFHFSGDTCRLCTLTSNECTEVSCTHYTGEDTHILKVEFQNGESTRELEFTSHDLKKLID